MRKYAAAVAVISLLVPAAAAVAAAPGYRQYTGGDASRRNWRVGNKPGVRLLTHAGRFYVISVVLPERCSNGAMVTARVGFEAPDASDRFSGPVRASGRFSVTVIYPRGKSRVSGRLTRSGGEMTFLDHGPLTAASPVICHGSHTFKLTTNTGGGGR